MVFQVTKELNNIIIVNQSIIASMKAQQARSYKELDRLQSKVHEEADLPSNRFLDWSKIVDSYVASVINSRVIDYEMLKRYEAYVKELIRHNNEYFMAQDELDQMQTNFESMMASLVELEERLEAMNEELAVAKQQALNIKRFKPRIEESKPVETPPQTIPEKTIHEPEELKKIVSEDWTSTVEEKEEIQETIEEETPKEENAVENYEDEQEYFEEDELEKSPDENALDEPIGTGENEIQEEQQEESVEESFWAIIGDKKITRKDALQLLMDRRGCVYTSASKNVAHYCKNGFLRLSGHQPVMIRISPRLVKERKERMKLLGGENK